MTGSGGKSVEFYSQFSDPLLGSRLLCRPPLSVTDGTCPSACMYIAWAVQMSGFWLSSSPLPYWVSNFAIPTKPPQQSHTEKKNCRPDETPGWELETWRLALSSKRGAVLCYLKGYMQGPSTTKERERPVLVLEPWQSERSAVWPLLFTGLG